MKLARRIAAAVLAGAALTGIATVVLNPPLVIALILWGNVAVAVWWAVHLLVTKRPW
jgi:heme A synthase